MITEFYKGEKFSASLPIISILGKVAFSDRSFSIRLFGYENLNINSIFSRSRIQESVRAMIIMGVEDNRAGNYPLF
jgi:hypothetical protein